MWIVPSSIRPLFAPGSECSMRELDSDSNISATDPALRCVVNGKPTLRLFSWRGWKNRPWSPALFGAAISPGSMAETGLASWISQLRDYRVNPTHSPENKSATTTGEVSEMATGRSRISSGSSMRAAPPWCSSKTSQLGLPLDGFDLSEINYREWVSRSRSRSLSLRRMLARRINENGFSSWPTARAEDSESPGNHPGAVDSLSSAARLWATPRAHDYKGGGPNTPENSYLDREAERFSLRECAGISGERSSQKIPGSRPRLNPAFSNWLMGNPWWWTRAERINCAASEMDAWRFKLLSHLSICFDGSFQN